MKNFPRVQKKGILSTRAIENSRLHNSTENFDEMVEKQLEDDFKVHEYLNENPNEGHNSQQYTALLNSLLVKKMCKVRRKSLLRSTKTQFQSTPKQDEHSQRGCSKSLVKGQAEDTYYSEEEYLAIKKESEAQQQIIEVRTEQELEMKRVLMKEITENKKSLNLLKGDIGHMITRNESISVLESKVNKVSLVSENQLKRVSLALTKDKEEVMLRQQMQKKFSLKLKTIECLENKNLKKIKGSYLQSMNRRRQIFENLHQIEKQCASIEEYSDKQKQKEEKNSKTLESFRLLKFACMAIQQSTQLWKLFSSKQISSYQFSQRLNTAFNLTACLGQKLASQELVFHIDCVTQDELNNICKLILAEYWRLTVEIQEKKKMYNQYLEIIQQYWTKLGLSCNKQDSILSQFNIEHRNELAIASAQQFTFEGYFAVFGKLSRNYRILYSLINFMNKKVINFTDRVYVTQIYKNQCFHVKIRESFEENKDFNSNLFAELQPKIKDWFQIIAAQIHCYDKIPAQAKEQMNKFLSSTQFSHGKQSDSKQEYGNQLLYSQFPDNISSTSSDKQKVNELNTDKQSSGETKSSSRIQSRFNNENSTAKRIQTLQKIDQSYYKMIKQTIEMEKENTMKNYQFQKSFKRNKYSSQDELLQQKRFEATFSNLFKQDPDEGSKFKSKQDSLMMSRVLNKDNNFRKSGFGSLHMRNKPIVTSKSSTFHLAKKNATFWQNQSKARLRRKLENVLSSL